MSESSQSCRESQGPYLTRRGFIAVAGAVGLSLAGCSGDTQPAGSRGPTTGPNGPSTTTRPQASTSGGGSAGSAVLIAYFSRTGNTRTVAEYIHAEISAELFQIVPQDPYPEDYDATVDQARKEQESDFRPRLSTHVRDMASYRSILLGFPNWWGTMPMALFTFLEEYDFTGKTIIPFCTHEGSRLGRSEQDIAALCPGAQLRDGLAIRGPSAKDSRDEVVTWVRGLGPLA